MAIYTVPTAPGRCRVLFSILFPKSAIPLPLRLLFSLFPKWWKHIEMTKRVLDGDSALLHAQVCRAAPSWQSLPSYLSRSHLVKDSTMHSVGSWECEMQWFRPPRLHCGCAGIDGFDHCDCRRRSLLTVRHQWAVMCASCTTCQQQLTGDCCPFWLIDVTSV